MIIPKNQSDDTNSLDLYPIKWKRFWLVMIAVTFSLFLVYLQQFSYSSIYTDNTNITYFVVLFKFIHVMMYLFLEVSFKNSSIVSPFIVTMTCIQFIIIIASKSMLRFLINFLVLYLLIY